MNNEKSILKAYQEKLGSGKALADAINRGKLCKRMPGFYKIFEERKVTVLI
jgi:hypothetical protein